MSLNHTRKGMKKTLALAIAAASTVSLAHAAEADDIQQLRNEVAELRVAVQQNTAKPAVDLSNLKITTANGTEVKFYGSLRTDANYIIEGNGAEDFSNPHTSMGDTKDALRVNVATTRFGFNFNTPTESGNKVGGKLEMDFASGFRIRHAYVTYNDFLIGQTSSTFGGGNSPEMLDFNGNTGFVPARQPMVRWGTEVAPQTKLYIAAEKGLAKGWGKDKDGKDTVVGVKYQLPAITAKVAYDLNGKGTVNARAEVERYKVGGDKKNGWGVGVGTTLNVAQPLTVYLDYAHTKGSNYFFSGDNAVGTDGKQSTQDAYQAGVTYKVLPNLRTNLGYGFIKNSEEGNTLGNKNVQQAWVNLIYSPVKQIELGVEYLDGKRKTFGGQSYKDNRVDLSARYNF